MKRSQHSRLAKINLIRHNQITRNFYAFPRAESTLTDLDQIQEPSTGPP